MDADADQEFDTGVDADADRDVDGDADTDADGDTDDRPPLAAWLAGIDCVVTAHDPPTIDATAVIRRVREVAPSLPVVVWTEADADVVGTAATDDGVSYVPRSPELLESLLVSRVRGAIDEAERSLAGLFEMVDDAVAVFDPDSRRVLAANDALLDRWGRENPPSRLDDLVVQARAADGRPAALVSRATEGRDVFGEWHCEDAAGNRFAASVRLRVDPAQGRGYLVADVPAPRDTDPSAGRGMLAALLESVPLSVYFKDTESRHVAVSDELPALLGAPYLENEEGKRHHAPADVLGKTDFDLYPEHLADTAIEDDQEVMATGTPIENRVERPFGDPLDGTYVSTSKAPWYGPAGQLRGIAGVTADVSRQMQYEAQLERQNERLAEFADFLTNDLRTPLNAARDRLQLYRETGDEDHLEAVATMHERMDATIDDVLTFARQGDRVDDPETVDGSAIAAEAWAAVDTGDATLEQDWAHDIEADPDRLARVFESLFRNAVDHADAGTVRVGTVAGGRGFYVADDGPGIPAGERDEVFDRRVTSEGATGFGLPIVREIAHAHGWENRLTEGDEGGARFEIMGVTPVIPSETEGSGGGS